MDDMPGPVGRPAFRQLFPHWPRVYGTIVQLPDIFADFWKIVPFAGEAVGGIEPAQAACS
jgi:hypothetical protein